LQKVDRHLGLIDRISEIIADPRDPIRIIHQQRDLLAQRIFSLALGYEDLNDQNSLRNDPALLASIKNHTEQEEPLGSSPTLSRFENRITDDELANLSKIFVELFLESYGTPQSLYEDVYCARGDMAVIL